MLSHSSSSLALLLLSAFLSPIWFPIPTIAQPIQDLIVQNSNVDGLSEAEKLYNQAFQLYLQGKYQEAIPLAEKIVTIKRQVLGENHPETAQSINDLATLYRDQGNYSQAEILYQQSIDILQRTVGENNPLTAKVFNNLAALYYFQSNYPKAETLYLQAINIYRQVVGEKHPQTAETLNNLALLYQNQGKYSQAESIYKESLAIYQEIFGHKHSDTATALNNLGLLYHSQGNYTQAEALFQESFAIRQEVLGNQNPDTAQSLNNLAFLYYTLGMYSKAEPLYQQALAIYTQLLGEKHPYTATFINNLAILYLDRGDYQEAEKYAQQALNIRREILGEKHPDTATSLNNLALLYYTQGDYSLAQKFYQQALTIAMEVLGEKHPDTATLMNNLAECYSSQGKYEEALPLYQKSLATRLEVLGENHPDIAQSVNNLANLYYIEGDYIQAENLYQQVINIYRGVFGDKHPNLAQAFNNLGITKQSEGKYAEAESIYQRGLSLRRELLGNNHPQTAQSLIHLASLSWTIDNIPSALTYLTEATEIEEKNLADFLYRSGDESRKQAYINTLFGTTNGTISLHLNGAPNNQQATNLALTTILRRKGRVLDAMSDIVATLRQNSNPNTDKIFASLADKRSQLASLTFKGKDDRNPTVYKELIDKLEGDIKKLETELSNQSGEFRTINQNITLEAVQKAIPPDTVLIEYMVYHPFNPKTEEWGKPRYAVYILHSEGEAKGIDLGETETIDKLVQEWRENLQFGDTQDLTTLQGNGEKLQQLIFQPLLPFLKSKTKLFISPDSQLNLIPFAALSDSQGRYLIENYTFNYLTSGRDLLRLQNRFQPQSEAVIVANPNYDLEINSNNLIASNSRGRNQRGVDLQSLNWCCQPLQGTKEEAQAIIPLLSNPIVYTGNEALVTNLSQIKAPKILHLATHGFFLPDVTQTNQASFGRSSINNQSKMIESENPLLRSGLALTGFNPQHNQMDGALTALSASSLYLWGTKLVVLSACQTGVGDVKNGDGVYGLRRAFVLAGAESQLMSLWDVFDEATKDLMIDYYQRLRQGEGRAEALRQVQLSMLRSEKYRHPVAWAAFIPSGDWGSL